MKLPSTASKQLKIYGSTLVKEAATQQEHNRFIFGTPSYIPPESLRGFGYNPKSDVFSAGSILFNLLTHKHLFPGSTNSMVIRENKLGDVNHVPYYLTLSHCQLGYSSLVSDLAMRLLNPDPAKRPTAAQALRHPWFNDFSGPNTM
jgi:serine/threonine protein kinase